MWEFGSERKLSNGSEMMIGEEDVDGFVNVSESSLSLALAMAVGTELEFFRGCKSSSGMGSGEWDGLSVRLGSPNGKLRHVHLLLESL